MFYLFTKHPKIPNTYQSILLIFLYQGALNEKSIGGSHGSLRPELAILEKIFSLPKIIFFLISLFSRRYAASFMYFILQHTRKKDGTCKNKSSIIMYPKMRMKFIHLTLDYVKI